MSNENSQSPVIDAKDIAVTLTAHSGPVEVLRGIDLRVERGEAVALLGPSGSGKSTLLSILAGLERASRGSINVCGEVLDHMSEDALAIFRRRHVGIVFQSFHLIPTMTALENVAVPLELAKQDNAFERAQARLDAVGLGHRYHHYPRQLSGGEQQRVALARALVSDPELLLADEPTGNLDGATGEQIVDLLFDFHDKTGTTFLLITHDETLARRCNRIVRLRDGLVDQPEQDPIREGLVAAS